VNQEDSEQNEVDGMKKGVLAKVRDVQYASTLANIRCNH